MKKNKPSVPRQHQIKIAYDTLKMHDAAVGVMGGMNKEEAREVLKAEGLYKGAIKKLDEMPEPSWVSNPQSS
jgi:hypothetical protein